jgi:hypothetical protein
MLFGEKPEEREPQQSKAGLAKAARDEIVTMGLLRKEKRRVGRSNAVYLVLTEKAWAWAARNLGTSLKKTPSAARVLEAVLRRLAYVVGSDGAGLERFALGPASTEVAALPAAPVDAASTQQGIEDRIRSAYLALTNGAVKRRVLLKDLRTRVAASREDLDQALQAMQTQRKLVLMGLDNPQERTQGDDDAALYIAGNPRHLVYLQE